MEISAISNTSSKKVNQQKRNAAVKSVIGCAGIGAVINGLQTYHTQKSILKSGDEFVKNYIEEMDKIVEPEIKLKAQESVETLKTFVKNGRIEPSSIAVSALKGAFIFAAVFTAVELISRAIDKSRLKKNNAAPKQI